MLNNLVEKRALFGIMDIISHISKVTHFGVRENYFIFKLPIYPFA